MTKPARLALLRKIGTRLALRDKMDNNIKTNTLKEAAPLVKRGRGRPRKNVIAEVEKSLDNFNFDKLVDDAGVILPKREDIHDEMALMGTRL